MNFRKWNASSTKTLLTATALATCWGLPASAQSVWSGVAGTGDSGNWGTAAHWTPNGVPNAVGAEVRFTLNPGGGPIVDLGGGAFTLGTMRFNTATSYLIGSGPAGGALTFQVGAGNALIEVTQTGNTINPQFVSLANGGSPIAVNLASNTDMTVAAGQTLWFGDNTTLAGAGQLIANGAGTVRIDAASTRTSDTRLVSGTVVIGNAGALGTGTVQFTAGTLRANTGGTLTNALAVAAGGALKFIVGNGLTLTQTGFVSLGNNVTSLAFGEAGNTGTLIFSSPFATYGGAPNFTVDVLGGTVRATTNVLGFFTGDATATNIAAGGTVEYLSTGAFNNRIRNLQAAGNIVVGTGANLLVGEGQSSGAVTGAGSLTLTTAGGFGGAVSGNLLLTGTNTYTGGTTIAAGATLSLGNGGTTGSIVGNVANAGSLVFNRSNAYQFEGIISGAGAVTKLGLGTTILTGANTYTGGTTIATGTLQIGNGGTGGSLAGNVLNTATLAFNRSDESTFGGVVSGTGILTKAGSGNLILSGNNTYTGNTTINGGKLSVNGSTATSILTTVNAGGTLGGSGTVGNTTIAGGTLAPGNSIGTITVQGSLAFTAASTYLIEIDPTTSDRTNVTGTAALGGATVSAIYAAGTYVNKKYTILNAAGGVNGQFGALVNTNLPATFASTLSYDPNNVYLNLALNFQAANFGNSLNINQTNVAAALANSFNISGGIPLAFGVLNAQGLTQVSGEAATGTQQTTFNAMDMFLGVMTDPFMGTRSGGARGAGATGYADEAMAYAAKRTGRTPAERDAYAKMAVKAPPLAAAFERRWSVWGAGYGGTSNTDGNAAVGSSDTRSRIYGGAAGLDYRLATDTLVGFSLGGAASDYNLTNGIGGGRSEMFQAGIYGRHFAGPAYIAAALAYAWQDVTTDRIALLNSYRANFDADAISGRLEGGWRFALGNSGLTPYAAGQFTTFFLPNYAEQTIAGVNTFALAYGEQDVTASRSELGLRADTSFASADAIVTLRGRAAWAHNFNVDRSIGAIFQTLPGSAFTVNGAAQARDSALVSAGAEARWLNGWSVAANFEGEFSNVTESYAGKGVVRYQW